MISKKLNFSCLFVSFISILLFCGKTFSQCADGASITSNSKCAILTWTIDPGTIPSQVIISGSIFSLVASTSNSGTYKNDGSNNANGCNNYGSYSGDITIGPNLCTYVNGALTGSQPLPVTLVDFNATDNDGNVALLWSTASESNNRGFEIEKSIDGLRWSKIGWVHGAGTTSEAKKYSFMGDALEPGNNYFRLKQIDFDGAFHYSHVINVYWKKHGLADFEIFPNPTNNVISISNLDFEYVEKIAVFNQLGQQILEVPLSDETIDVSGLEKGMYYFIAIVNNVKLTKRLVVN